MQKTINSQTTRVSNVEEISCCCTAFVFKLPWYPSILGVLASSAPVSSDTLKEMSGISFGRWPRNLLSTPHFLFSLEGKQPKHFFDGPPRNTIFKIFFILHLDWFPLLHLLPVPPHYLPSATLPPTLLFIPLLLSI